MKNQKLHIPQLTENSFKAISDSATDSIIIADEESTILYCNKKTLELFGYKQDEIIGKSLTIFMPKRYHETHLNSMKRFVSTGKAKFLGKTIELSALKKNQMEFPIEVSLSSWNDDGSYFFAGIIRDITEKTKIMKEMEILQSISTAISKSDSFNDALRLTINIICQEAGGVYGEAWVFDKTNKLIEYAPVWYLSDKKFEPFVEVSKKSNYKPSEGIVGSVFMNNIIWNPDISEFTDFKRKEIAEEVGFKSLLAVPIVTNKGEVFASLIFYFSDQKEEDVILTRLVVSLANQLGIFLEKKLTEEELKKSRDFYLTILDDFPAMIWRTNMEGKAVYYNKSWLEFTGNSLKEELRIGWLRNDISEKDLKNAMRLYEESFKKRTSFENEYQMRRYDGKVKWILNFSRPFYDTDGQFKGYLGVCYDITEQKNNIDKLNKSYTDLKRTTDELLTTKEQLNKLNSELEVKVKERTKDLKERNESLVKINRDLDNFIYIASHDLKAPIANIEGLTTVLLDTISQCVTENEETITLISMIQESISKFNKTIGELTEISKVQRMEKDDIAPQNLVEIIEDVKVLLSDLIKESRVDIQLKMEQCPSIEFSKKDMRSVIMNLLSNAIRFRAKDRKPVVLIECYKIGGYSILSVTDNGIGIDLNKVKLFRMFKRYSSQSEGTGIGLYIIKRIVEDSGGKIEVDSEVGEGTTFRVYFKNHE